MSATHNNNASNNVNNNVLLDVKNLSSRKLFELLSSDHYNILNRQQQQSVEQELLEREHYLPEMKRLRATHPLLVVN